MSDLISRRGIVDKVCEGISCNECSFNEIDGQSGCLLALRIENLPTAEPERKVGKWIRISPAKIYECSECGQNVMTSDIECYKYCHGCGAKMEDK